MNGHSEWEVAVFYCSQFASFFFFSFFSFLSSQNFCLRIWQFDWRHVAQCATFSTWLWTRHTDELIIINVADAVAVAAIVATAASTTL